MNEIIYRPNVNIKHFVDESGLSQCTIEVNCSKCGIKLTRHTAQTAEEVIKNAEEFATNYCPNCGAKLRRDEPKEQEHYEKLYPVKYRTNAKGHYALIKKSNEIFLVNRKAKDTNYYLSQILCTDDIANAFKEIAPKKENYPCINKEKNPSLFDEWTVIMLNIYFYQYNNNLVGEKE